MSDFLHARHAEEGQKFHAILIGAAGSAIAFALHETANRPLSWSLSPILAAVLLWGVSFAVGILQKQETMQAIKSNVLLLEAQEGNFAKGVEISQQYLGSYAKRTLTFQNAQIWALLAGVLLYIGGHVWHLTELRNNLVQPAGTPSALAAERTRAPSPSQPISSARNATAATTQAPR